MLLPSVVWRGAVAGAALGVGIFPLVTSVLEDRKPESFGDDDSGNLFDHASKSLLIGVVSGVAIAVLAHFGGLIAAGAAVGALATLACCYHSRKDLGVREGFNFNVVPFGAVLGGVAGYGLSIITIHQH